MSANSNDRDLGGLSLQPHATATAIVCPKCQHKRTASDPGPDWQCPNCGIAYNKAMPPSADAAPRATNTGPSARRAQATQRDDWDNVTPGPLSLSLTGRLGRLRYLAYSWPVMLITGLAIMAAVLIPALHRTGSTGFSPGIGTMVLMVVVLVLWFYLSLRLMALRLHDLNRSSKWLLALMILPAVFGVLGAVKLAALSGGLFWIMSLLLILWPGTDGDNDYGPPPGPNSLLVQVGAGVILIFAAFGVIAQIKMMHSGKFNPMLTNTPATAQNASGSDTDTDAYPPAQFTKIDLMGGAWKGENMSFRVNDFGDGEFAALEGGNSITSTGPVRILDGRHIAVGLGANAYVLNVTAPPHRAGGVARMSINGVELTKAN
jgi:uncharacterized membrane protein YhaH (DUF805 family)